MEIEDFYNSLGDALEGIQSVMPDKSGARRGMSEVSMVTMAVGTYLVAKEVV